MEYIVETKHLTVKYGSKIAIDDVTIKLDRGKIIGLLGPNGAGKTTLIKTLMKMLLADSGEILIDGMKPSEKTKAITAYLPDKLLFDDNTKVAETLRVFKDFFSDFDDEKADKMMTDLGVDKTVKIKELNKGMKERLQIALIMSRKANLYLLDEPLASVDPSSRQYILETIIAAYSKDATVLISTHLIHDIEPVLDEAVFIKDGKIILHENVDEIREREHMSIEDYFKEVFKC